MTVQKIVKAVCMLMLLMLAADVRGEEPLERFFSREYDGGADGTLKYQLLRPKNYD